MFIWYIFLEHWTKEYDFFEKIILLHKIGVIILYDDQKHNIFFKRYVYVDNSFQSEDFSGAHHDFNSMLKKTMKKVCN